MTDSEPLVLTADPRDADESKKLVTDPLLACDDTKSKSSRISHFLHSPTLRIVVFGQIISLLLCGTGVASSYIAQDGVNVPTTQSFINYFLLAVIFIPVSIYRGEFVPAFKARWWIYLLIAAVDVEANFAFVKAYQYTSLTSIQVLDCFTIPCVIILGRIFLKTPFPLKKLASVVVCLGGIACLITADVTTSRNDGPAGAFSAVSFTNTHRAS